ncbi:hypothetical protein [Actinoplanes sp. NPDC051851]|uniref:hypothetical protein n=1 Tax=Actinoplanes sp. NPDC051851 TaxID=3154753 RepID=UPI00343917EF
MRDGVDDDEQPVLVWLCTQLPGLRASAGDDGWRPRLDAAVTALRSGVPASQVCRRLGLTFDPATTGSAAAPVRRGDAGPGAGPATLGGLRLNRVSTAGDYVCPHGSCERRARADRHGHEPDCIDGTPMLPSAGPAARS